MASGVEENIYGFRGRTLRGKERGARGSSSSRNLVDESSDDEEDDDQVETLLMALEEFEDLVEE
uniref:Putative ovule protein n=1 Tax=Solanum chacoense TaxID=4108 RepID=A0A0V0GTA1_SOLCH